MSDEAVRIVEEIGEAEQTGSEDVASIEALSAELANEGVLSQPIVQSEEDTSEDDETTADNPSATRRNIFVMDGHYYKYTGGHRAQLKIVSNFILQVKAKVVHNKNWSYRCTAIRSTGEEYEIELFRDDFMGGAALKVALSSICELEYYGTSYDTTQIQGILADQMPPVVKGTGTNGMHIVDGRLVYVEGEQAVDKDGLTQDIVYINKSYQAHRMPCLLDQPELSTNDLHAIAQDLCQLNYLMVACPTIGFIGYCFVKEALVGKVSSHNPFLLCQGEPGAGKSQTISRIIQPILGSQQPLANIGSVSEFVLALNSSTTNMTPVCYDEYKYAVLSKAQRRIIANVLLASYAQNTLERGRMNMTVDNYPFTAPLVLAGEMTIDSTSQKHRMIEVYFSSAREVAMKRTSNGSLKCL